MANPSFDIQIRCSKSLKKKYCISEALLRMTIRKILGRLGWKKAVLSLWLMEDEQIRILNKQYLKHDGPTDVISFSQWEGKKIKGPSKAVPLGDLAVSLETTARQAEEYGNSFFYELAFYLCHGILHLMGHSDKTKEQARRMERRQTAILSKIQMAKSK